MKLDLRFLLLLACFVLSGFAGLVYQTAWTLEFSLVFGTSELALVTVLAAYMAGLALGAAAAGRLAHRVRRPVLVYAVLELGIGAAALLVPAAIDLAGRLHGALLGGHDLPPAAESAASGLFYLASSFAILLVPTALMGATLPLLARHAVRRESEIGRRVGVLYTANTAGAAAGTLAAAFWLLPRLGLGRTVLAAAAVNVAVFGLAALLARRPAGSGPAVESDQRVATDASSGGGRWILPAMLVSGAVSFTWEVVWTRLLAQLLGGSVYAFATMLATFLTGIALGAAVAARLATGRERARTAFAVAQLGVAGLFLAAYAATDRLAAYALPAAQEGALARGALLAAALLLPGTVAIGATFPLAVRILARGAADAASASAKVFAWNTAGAIAGALAAGYLLLPGLGFADSAAAAAAASLVLAAVAALAESPRRRLTAGAAAAGLLLLALAPPSTPWRVVRHSPMTRMPAAEPVTHFGVGRSATVLLTEGRTSWRLTTNGLPESSIERPWGRAGRYVVARWLSLLPVLARPETRSMLVIGLGAGVTASDLPASIEEIHVVELEPEVVRANRAVAEGRLVDPLADPRLRLHLNDARGALRLTARRFDAIVSQPSHPWTSGASNLFTAEFFSLVRERLDDDGVFVQWMGLPFVDGPLLRSLVATALEVFPHVELYRPLPGAVLVLASKAPFDASAAAPLALEAARRQWSELGVLSAQDLLAARALDAAGARAFAEGAAVSTDHRNLFRSRSPAVLGRPLGAAGADRMLAPHEPLAAPRSADDALYLVRRLIRQGETRRARRLADAMTDAAAAHTGFGLTDLAAGRAQAAAGELRRALRLDPDSTEARAAVLELHRTRVARGESVPLVLRDLAPLEAAIVDGWRLDAAGDWRGVRRLEDGLAAVGRRHPLSDEAVRLRASWRTGSGEERLAGEALELLTPLLAPTARPRDLLLRAAAAGAAGRPRVALASLAEALAFGGPAAVRRTTARQAGAILRSLPAADGTEDWRRQLRERIDRRIQQVSG